MLTLVTLRTRIKVWSAVNYSGISDARSKSIMSPAAALIWPTDGVWFLEYGLFVLIVSYSERPLEARASQLSIIIIITINYMMPGF